jgi:hypothetical protein
MFQVGALQSSHRDNTPLYLRPQNGQAAQSLAELRLCGDGGMPSSPPICPHQFIHQRQQLLAQTLKSRHFDTPRPALPLSWEIDWTGSLHMTAVHRSGVTLHLKRTHAQPPLRYRRPLFWYGGRTESMVVCRCAVFFFRVDDAFGTLVQKVPHANPCNQRM